MGYGCLFYERLSFDNFPLPVGYFRNVIPRGTSSALSVKKRCVSVSSLEPEAVGLKAPIFLFLSKGKKGVELGVLFDKQLSFGDFRSFHA